MAERVAKLKSSSARAEDDVPESQQLKNQQEMERSKLAQRY
jgi:hypothetical protein